MASLEGVTASVELLKQLFIYCDGNLDTMYLFLSTGIPEDVHLINTNLIMSSRMTKGVPYRLRTVLDAVFPFATITTTKFAWLRSKLEGKTEVLPTTCEQFPLVLAMDDSGDSTIIQRFYENPDPVVIVEGPELANRFRDLGGTTPLLVVDTQNKTLVFSESKYSNLILYDTTISAHWLMLGDTVVATKGDNDFMKAVKQREELCRHVPLRKYAVAGAPGSCINKLIKSGEYKFADSFSDFGLHIF